MRLRRLIQVLIKEYRHILREPRAMGMVFLSPAFVLIALSALFASGTGHVELALWDHDHSALSQQFADALRSDADFSITYASDYAEIDQLLVDQRVDAAVVIPPGFAAAARDGDATVQVILDGVDSFAASQATSSLLGQAARFGLALSSSTRFSAPLQVYPQSAYSQNNGRRNSMIPGLIPIVFSLPAMAAALAMAREREAGSLESLIATPVRGAEYIGGKLLAYVSAALVGLLPVWLVATLAFQVPFRGNVLLFVLLSADFLLASLGQAIFIGSMVRSQQTATVISLFVFFVPGFFLAGLIDPIDPSGAGAWISYAMPVTHFVTICRALFVKGAGLLEVWKPALALLGLSVVWGGLSILTFQKRLRQ